jgi:hypothetical protein
MDKKTYIDRTVCYNENKLQHNEKGPALNGMMVIKNGGSMVSN